MDFTDQVVIVTGAGRGLGAAYAKLFADKGATVVVNDAGVDRAGTGDDHSYAEKVVQAIQTKGGKARANTLNLASEEACEHLIAEVFSLYGRIDVLVHSAGLVAYKGIEETTNEEWVRMRSINIDAPFWLSRAVWPAMKDAQYGRIIMTVSGFGLKTFENSDVTGYGAGKGAQFGFVNGLAGEGMAHGIHVNAISPVAKTRMFRKEIDESELPARAVAPAVVMLGSKECPFTGKVIGAAGGNFSLSEMQPLGEWNVGKEADPEEVLKMILSSENMNVH